jgi:hypothetical protein
MSTTKNEQQTGTERTSKPWNEEQQRKRRQEQQQRKTNKP